MPKTQKPLARLGCKRCHDVTATSGIGTPEEQVLEAARGGSINNCQEQGGWANLMGELSPLGAWRALSLSLPQSLPEETDKSPDDLIK